MPVAVDPKPSRQRFDQHPRAIRKKPQAVVLDDEAEARLRMTEAEYRRELFRSFVSYCRDAGSWVVSAPFERQCRVLMPPDSPLLERLAQLPKYPVVKMPGISHRLQGGRFIPVIELQVTLWRA
jgi:hypothetical protein